MIYKNDVIKIERFSLEYALDVDGNREAFREAIFFDLEHYVYKKPICIGVFGACCYNNGELQLTQYMIENKKDSIKILEMAEQYFKKQKNENDKKYLVTFSGNNDYTMIKYLFKKNGIDFDINEQFIHVDLQKYYEKYMGVCTGLKKLEKIFEIDRESELISGTNLAKTFSKIVKDDDYINRMSKDKIKKILLYNEQDIVSLFHMYINWNKYVSNNQ